MKTKTKQTLAFAIIMTNQSQLPKDCFAGEKVQGGGVNNPLASSERGKELSIPCFEHPADIN
jgi:hypothetical protein